MAEQLSAEQEGEATFTSIDLKPDDEPVEVSPGVPRVENGQLKLPPEAMALLQNALNDLPVHRHLEELKVQDPVTYAHSRNVAANTLALVWMNRADRHISDEDVAAILRAALLHDMGKLDLGEVPQVRQAVDSETGEPRTGRIAGQPIYEETGEIVKLHQVNRVFTSEERARVSRHAMLSAARIQEGNHIDNPLILSMIVLHHQIQKNPMLSMEDAEAILEGMEMSADEKQKLYQYVQMLEVSDKFDASISNRPDKSAKSPQETYDYLSEEFALHGGDLNYVNQIVELYYPNLRRNSMDLESVRP